MKNKIFVFTVLWLFMMVVDGYASNALTAPYSFVISNATQTTFRITMSDSNDVAPDSLALRYIAGSDTTLKEYLTVGARTARIVNLSPGITYTMLLTNVRGDSCASSNKDTLSTLSPVIESGSRTQPNIVSMKGARYDPTYSSATWDTFYVSTSAGLDSTQVYWAAEYLGLQAKAIGNADSCQVKLLVFNGNATPDIFGFENVAQDSLLVTKAGWTMPKKLTVWPSQYIYIRADGQTANGNATKLLLNLYRYGEISHY